MESGLRPTPAQIRAVFASNLKLLLGDGISVASLCRQLGINRTQFNRFLAGEAYPRPDILHIICSHFGVDARILTQPLASIENAREIKIGQFLRNVIVPNGNRPFDHFLFPDGYYQYWRRSFSAPGKFVTGIWKVQTIGELKAVRGLDVYSHPIRRGGARFARALPWNGIISQGFDGLVMVTRAASETLLTVSYFEVGLQASTKYINGISMLARRRMKGAERLSPVLAQRFEGNYAEFMRLARQSGVIEYENLPQPVADYLRSADLN